MEKKGVSARFVDPGFHLMMNSQTTRLVLDEIEDYIVLNLNDWIILETSFRSVYDRIIGHIQSKFPAELDVPGVNIHIGQMLGEFYADRLYSINKKRCDVDVTLVRDGKETQVTYKLPVALIDLVQSICSIATDRSE